MQRAGLTVMLLLPALLAAVPPSARDRRILVLTKTAGFRHDSIPDAIAATRRLGGEDGFAVVQTENAALFADATLGSYDAVVFLLTTGDVLDASQEAALQHYIQGGGGFVGVHSATDTEKAWPWYVDLVGASFAGHPAVQPATLHVIDAVHPSTRALPRVWDRIDEWYDFLANPRTKVHVLATLDETTYSGGTMGADHPISWCHFYDGGRAWYTALGHTRESYAKPLFLEHLRGGISFAAGYPDCDERRAPAVPPRPSR